MNTLILALTGLLLPRLAASIDVGAKYPAMDANAAKMYIFVTDQEACHGGTCTFYNTVVQGYFESDWDWRQASAQCVTPSQAGLERALACDVPQGTSIDYLRNTCTRNGTQLDVAWRFF